MLSVLYMRGTSKIIIHSFISSHQHRLTVLQENDGNKVVKDIIHGPCKKKYRYCKVIYVSLVLADNLLFCLNF
jgi:hypothetical protein